MCMKNFSYDKNAYLCFYEEGTRLLQQLDNKFMSFVQDIKHVEIQIPSIINGEVLERCGYFQTFPQHLTMVYPLQNIERNKDNVKNSSLGKGYYLTPAACVHIYPMMEKNFKEELCYTTLESVYRYENGNFQNPERLWEFTVREFVFVGTKNFVVSMLENMKIEALNLARSYFPEAEINGAHDNFYPSHENKIKSKIQIANHLKDELLVEFNNRKIAIASFNYHNFHFSKAFNFDQNGEIVTGCVGFGMERWALCCEERGIKTI